MAIVERNKRGQFTKVTPGTVKMPTREEIAYREQRENARIERERVRNARRAGYRGPLTRAELAARTSR